MSEEEKNIELQKDLLLVNQYKENKDQEALTTFFKKYMGLIYGVALKYLKDDEKSKDTVMDIYEKITKKLLTHNITNPKAWLYTITKNHCYEILRKNTRFMERENEAQFMYSEEVFRHSYDTEKEQELNMLEDCIGTLEDQQQKTIRLFYLEKMTYKEICNQMGIKWDKARSLIQNGRRNLKKCMEQKYESIKEK